MRVLAGDLDVEPALAKRALHRAYGRLRVLQHRTLLDMRLEVRAHLDRLGVALVANGPERIAHRNAVDVLLRMHLLGRVDRLRVGIVDPPCENALY